MIIPSGPVDDIVTDDKGDTLGSGYPSLQEDLRIAWRSGELRGFLYERIAVSLIPLLYGRVALGLFKRIYKNLSVGVRPRCSGRMSVVMARNTSIAIGDDFIAISDQRRATISVYSPCKLRTLPGGNIRIGNRVALNGTSVTSRRSVQIGDGTMIAANVVIIDADLHRQWPPDTRMRFPDSGVPVTIGRNVWIGMGTMVLKGSTIGDNSIIGAGSVVTSNVPANVVAAGNPARVLRSIGKS